MSNKRHCDVCDKPWNRTVSPTWFFVKMLTGKEIGPKDISPMEYMQLSAAGGPIMESVEQEFCSSECLMTALMITKALANYPDEDDDG